MSIELRALDRSELDFAQKLLRRSCAYDDAAVVADELLFGRAPGVLRSQVVAARRGEQLCGVVATSGEWLRVLAVDPDMRTRGVGMALLAAAESAIASEGHHTIKVLSQPGNYLAPGVDLRNTTALAWLVRRGYEAYGNNTNLLIDVRDNTNVSPARAQLLSDAAHAKGYTVSRAHLDDAPELAAIIEQAFSASWAFEIERSLHFSPCGLHVARTVDGEFAAFAAHDGNNAGLGWFGPAGTLEAHRGKGLGAALLMACLVDVGQDHNQCTVAWIGPRKFYDRVAGIAAERHFTLMRKSVQES